METAGDRAGLWTAAAPTSSVAALRKGLHLLA